jgi:hypothetical protein
MLGGHGMRTSGEQEARTARREGARLRLGTGLPIFTQPDAKERIQHSMTSPGEAYTLRQYTTCEAAMILPYDDAGIQATRQAIRKRKNKKTKKGGRPSVSQNPSSVMTLVPSLSPAATIVDTHIELRPIKTKTPQ